MSSPSNNLKEQVIKIILTRGMPELPGNVMVSDMSIETQKAADKILNLILDSILASKEMQAEPLNNTVNLKNGRTNYPFKIARNKLRAELRGMMRGLKS